MRFRPGARLDTGQVQDRRGMGGGRGLAVGGGGAGALIVVLLFAVLGVDLPGGGTDPFSLGTGAGAGQAPSELSSTCRTGSDANQREDCRIVGVVNSVQDYWGEQRGRLPRGADAASSPARPRPAAGRDRQPSARSTAPPTRPSTSTSTSTTNCARASAPAAARSPRPT